MLIVSLAHLLWQIVSAKATTMQASTATASSLRSAFLARSKVWIAGVVLRRAAMLLYKEFMLFLYPSSWSALNVSKALPSLGALYAARLIDCRARRSFPNIFISFRCSQNALTPLVRVAVSDSFVLGHPCTVTHADGSCILLEDSVLTCICHIGAETAHLIHDRATLLSVYSVFLMVDNFWFTLLD